MEVTANFSRYQNTTINHLFEVFFEACKNNDVLLMDYLLTESALQQSRDFFQHSALVQGSVFGCLEVVKYVLTTYPNIQSDAMLTTLHTACRFNHQEVIEYLIFDYKIQNNIKAELLLAEQTLSVDSDGVMFAKNCLNKQKIIDEAEHLHQNMQQTVSSTAIIDIKNDIKKI